SCCLDSSYCVTWSSLSRVYLPFFLNATAPTEIYTLSLHDALPISQSNLAKRDPRRNHETRSVDDRRAPDVGPTAARPPGRSRTTAAPATPLRERAAAVTTAPAPPGKPRGCARRWRPTRSGPQIGRAHV